MSDVKKQIADQLCEQLDGMFQPSNIIETKGVKLGSAAITTDDEPKCKSCGVAYRDHLGFEWTCKQLQEAKAEIERLKIRYADQVINTSMAIDAANSMLNSFGEQRKKMLGVIEMLGGERFVSVDTVHEAILRAREIMAEIKAGES